ncbi:MAG TPA: NF038122 family metalloprotease, partial [Caulobacteraceae bacterium]|nr:NF038122 family metalloprotease [Caulobacteraceae bacterium]
MNINIIYDASVATNPQEAAFKATVAGVAAFFDSEFSNPITINWDVGWGEVNGSPIPGGAGAESQSNYTNQYSYSQLKAAFTADNDTTALASLPATDPTAGGNGGFSMTTAEGKALGLVTANNAAIDGWSGLDTTSTWIYNTTNTAGGNVPAGDSDAFSFLAHELSEVMGRQMNFGANSGDGVAGDGYYPEDLFDYTANGVRALTNSATADRYFSTDGGTANTAQHYFNNVAS